MMNSPTTKTQTTYRPDIDGLRAIAIISVVFYHAGFSGFSGGFVGVDVFFVISGFLITSQLFNELLKTGHLNLGAFYARRVRRLMPAGFVVVAVTLLLGAFLLPPASDEQRELSRSAIAFSYFGSNFYFFKATGGYFDAPSFSMPLLHTWSLAVEEQYYLLWPLIMLLIFRLSGESRSDVAAGRRAFWVLGIMFVISLALCVLATPGHQKFTFYLLPARVWEFAIGGMVGLAPPSMFIRLRRWGGWLALVGLGMITYSVGFWGHDILFPGWVAMVPVFGTAFVIAGTTADEHGLVRRLLALRPMVIIGLLSYSWYLWHWPLLSVFRIYNLGMQDVPANAVLILVALLLAWVTYVWVEVPIRVRRPRPFRNVRQTLLAGFCIALASLLMGGGLKWWRGYQKELDIYRDVALARNDFSPYQRKCNVFGVQPIVELPGAECIVGPEKAHAKVVLWGDSHADHLMPMLIEAFPDAGVYQLTMPGCVPVPGYESLVPVPKQGCAEFNRRVLQRILELRKSGLEGVVISARWTAHLWHPSISVSEHHPSPPARQAPEKMAEARAVMQARLNELLDTLQRSGLRVLVVAPTPELVYSAPQCLGLRKGAICNVPRAQSDSLLADSAGALTEVVSRHSNARVAQSTDFFCDKETCFASRNGKILYADDDHITATSARELGHFLQADLNWVIGKRGG